MTQLLNYTGQKQPNETETLPPYLPASELVEAVNLAIYLERPLLLRGEPGCGKTRLAEMVAFELGLPYFAWHIQSTSRAKDGFYTYDAVRRLHDVQLVAAKLNSALNPERPEDYLKFGPLGQAFLSEQRPVVLIDEIDKADIDFPNDLLLALDENRFIIDETGVEVHAQQKPIVFITSNDEKELPDAFLRRCLFFYIDFPGEEHLLKIVKAHLPDSPAELVLAAINRFVRLRDIMRKDKGEAGKKVSTSELLDWLWALLRDPEAMEKLEGPLPYAETLLKTRIDLQYRQLIERTQP